MKEFIDLFIKGLIETSAIEWIAVLSNITYVLLIAKKNKTGWIFGFIGALLYVFLCYSQQLYLESFLQIFYVLMAILGFMYWNKEFTFIKKQNKTEFNTLQHAVLFTSLFILSLIIGHLFEKHTLQKSPYVDSFTTTFSFFATYLVIIKYRSNWIYWIVINTISIYLYHSRDFVLSAVLYLIMTILAVYGWYSWKKK